MAIQPSHPLESKLHHELRDALNQRLTSTDFFVWIDVDPLGDRDHFEEVKNIAEETEKWLSSLDPDSAASGLPELHLKDDAAAEVTIRAIPKKREARGYRADQIVGNPEPVVAGWI